MLKKWMIFVVTLLLFQQLVGASGEKFHLKYKLLQGKCYQIDIATNQQITMLMGEQQMSLEQVVGLNQEVMVKDIEPDSILSLEFSYKHIRFNQLAMGVEVSWDSDQDVDPNDFVTQQLADAMKSSLESKVSVRMDQYGNALSNNIADVLAGNRNISGLESGMLMVYPKKALSLGDTWEVTVQPDLLNDFKISSVYKLEEIKDNEAVISFSGTLSGKGIMGQEAKLNGTIEGESLVDIGTGWILEAEIHQSMEMEMMQEGVPVPMTIKSTIKLNTLP